MEFVRDLDELCSRGQDMHWFCPRKGEDNALYYEEDLVGNDSTESEQQKKTRLIKVEEARNRLQKALQTMVLFAFDGEDAIQYQEKLKSCLQTQLTRCDICVREFHRSRTWLRQTLDQEYTADEVESFMNRYDAMNNARIKAGLNNMTETLVDMPPADRSILAAGDVGMYAMFEALHCKSFLNNEDLLCETFDRPFRLVQTRKKLTLPHYAPGMSAFLFSGDQDRRSWAERNFGKIKRPLFASEFEHSVKPFLELAMRRINIISLDLEFLPTFWRGTRLLLTQMTQELIQNNLRAMEDNLYLLSLEHFQIDAPHFADLTASYRLLLQKAPDAFWEAMGTVSPQNVVETICRAPRLEILLTSKEEHEHGQAAYLEQELAWVDALMNSIKPTNLVPPLRTLLDLFLHTYQGEQYSHYASIVTWEMGLDCLLRGIKTVMTAVDGGPVYTHLIEAVSRRHIQVILQELQDIEKKGELQITKTQNLGLSIVENALALDVKSLARDRRVIERTRELDHEIGLQSLDIWKLSTRHVRPGYPALVMAIFSGISGLLPLEKLPPKSVQAAPKSAESWNNALSRVLAYVQNELLDRVDTFSSDQLIELFQEASAARGIMSLLFNGNVQIHNTALGILKSLSGEDSRRDSLMHVIGVFFGNTLGATSHSLKLISDARVFGPCLVLLKLCRDMFSCLCDTQDGFLRSHTVSSSGDVAALRLFWNRTWAALETIFDRTESWSSLGHDKAMMQEFCRESMDFADFAFDQYSIFASTLETGHSGLATSHDIGKQLLQQTRNAFKSITKWLRLRDDYLISKAVGLTVKILARLQEVGIQVSAESAQYIEDIVLSTDQKAKVKTKLTMNHKAQLQRALEHHTGEPLSDSAAPPKKQSSLRDWTKTGSESRSGSSTPAPGSNNKAKGVIDVESWSNHAAARKDLPNKQPMQRGPSLAQQRAAQKAKEDQANFLASRKKAKEEQERQRKAALAKANLGAGTGVAGIGNFGKDHDTTGQTVMVGDSDLESSEDEDDDLDDDLFGGSIKPAMKSERSRLDVSGASGLKPEVKATRIQRTVRSVKDRRARLAPDLAPLHHMILGWEFFHDGDYPPNMNPEDFSEVSNSFRDPVTYQQTFEPLLTLEAWQGMVKAREENGSKPYEIKVQNRSNVDRFIEVSSIIGQQENRELQLAEGDIILLSKAPKPADDPDSPHCLARIYRIKRQKTQLEVVYQVMPSSTLTSQLTMHNIVYGLKVQSITPLEREYGALKALQFYDLCNQIVRAKPSGRINFSDRQISQLQDAYNLNKAQSEAVNAAMENEGFSLIQGPPGTGKTKTIIAIVGGLLSQTLGSQSKGATRISMPRANGTTNTGPDAPSRKLLVCAPSNAAVDELVMRLKDGVKTKSGDTHQINVVRIGRSDNINNQVLDVTMNALVDRKLGATGGDARQRERNEELFKEHQQISASLRELFQQRDTYDSKEQPMDAAERKKLEDTIIQTKRRKAELGTRIDSVKDQERNAGREQELNRKRAQQAVLDEAHVICATLSGSGHDMFQGLNIEFETVIIDEAAQCVEMSSLIPLKYGCIKCIMVGDPKQLPPTVFSKEAAKFQYEQSLFVRMQNNHPDQVHLLDTQYRMHPEISIFPSRTFYDEKLMDGNNMESLRRQPWHKSALLAPYRFYDVKGQHQAAPKGHSLINIAEIDVAINLYDRLKADFRNYDFSGKIGIITPYKSQLNELKKRFGSKYGPDIADFIEFNTTDAFQGRESEIIIFSCVRASPAGGIGFLQDIRRMNVGLTRAKSSLWVLGNSDSLIRGQYWKKLVDDAQARDCYTTGNILQMLQKPSDSFPANNSNTHSMLDIHSHVPQMESGVSSRDANKPDKYVGGPPASATSDKMDGVQYKFEDRLKTKSAQQVSGASPRSGTERPDGTTGNASEDVRMEDADVVDGEPSTTPADDDLKLQLAGSASTSRTGTPVTGEEDSPTLPNGAGRPRPVGQPKPLLKKRAAAPSPFMPKKPRLPPR